MPGRDRRLAALYRTLARLDAAGVPPIQRAAMLQEQFPGTDAAARAFAAAYSRLGLPSEELRRRHAVPASHVAVIASGETMGRVDLSLDSLAESCEQNARLQAELARVLLKFGVAWLVVALVVPLGLLITSGLGAYLARALPILLIPPLISYAMRAQIARRASVPGLAEPLRLLALTRFCRTLALLNAAGLPMPRTLRDAAAASAHPDVSKAGLDAAKLIETTGATLTGAIRSVGLLRPVEMSLVVDGEMTGRLDRSFKAAADLLEHEAISKLQWRIRIFGAVLFLILAIYTATQLARAVAVQLPDVGA